MLNILKDYLISVGMQVDKQSFSQADKAIKDVDKGLGKFANSATGKFVKVGAGAVALASAVAVAMAKFASSVAEADRQVGLLARRLYTTKENARSLSIAMKQMNVASLDQLREMALDPESRQQFLELKNLARSLENPKTQQALKEIRAMNQEWKKLMVRFEYFKIEVAGKILEVFKQMKPTIQKIIDWFKPIIQSFMGLKNSFKGALPNIIKGIKYVWSLLKPILGFIRSLAIFIIKGWKLILDGIREMPTAFKTSFQAIKFILDPIIKIFEWIEDLFVYLTGGKSYGELMYDRLPWLKQIREGENYTPTPEEQERQNRKTVRAGMKNIRFDSSKAGGRTYAWGQSVHGFTAGRVDKYGNISKEGLLLSQSNLLALQSLGDALGVVAKRFKITSGFEGGHSINSQHHYGRAMDFGFAGTTLHDQLALIRATLNDANISKALLEVDAKTKNQIYNQLTAEGADMSKLSWINTPSGRNHLHVENVEAQKALENRMMQQPQYHVTNNNFNITSTDPKESMTEANRMLTLMYGKGGITP